jgi:hypothetical protein
MYNVSHDYLPWEYHKKIRPWFQPYLFAGLFKFFSFSGVNSPFLWMDLTRIISVILLYIGLYSFWKRHKNNFRNHEMRKMFTYMTFFLWFLPYFGTRTSSETLATIVFLFSIELFLLDRKKWLHSLIIGILFGVTFLIRFHFAVMIFFLCLWALVNKKKDLGQLAVITASYSHHFGGSWY